MDRMTEFCRENLCLVDLNIDERKMAGWTSEFHYRYSILDVIKLYLSEIHQFSRI